MRSNTLVAPEGVILFNGSGLIALASEYVYRLFNCDEKELINASIEKIIIGGQLLLNQHNVDLFTHRHSATPEASKEASGLTKDGIRFPLEISLNHFYGGNDLFTVAFVKRKNSSVAKIKTSDRQNAPRLFLILDNHSAISLINHYGSKILGCVEEALYGLNWFEYFLPIELLHHSKATFNQSYSLGVFEDYESPLLSLKGEQCMISWSTDVIYDTMGVAVGTLNSGLYTGKKRTMEMDSKHVDRIKKINEQPGLSLQEQNQELRRSLVRAEAVNRNLQFQIKQRKETEVELIKFQRLYDTMVQNFPDGIIGILNKEMVYVMIAGKELNEIDLPAFGLIVEGDDKNAAPLHSEELLVKIKAAFDGQSVSFEVKAKERSYTIFAVPLPDEKNNINEILCVFKNVTEKNRIEGMLKEALEKEKELSELKSRFVTMACHEFKTPLATIQTSSFLLENLGDKNYDDERLVHTNRIRRSVTNLTMILNEFLSLEKLEKDNVKLVYTTINIQHYIEELIAETEHNKQNAQVIEYTHRGTEQIIRIDHHLLWSIITNLVSNALKYSSPDDKIELSTITTNNILTIKVKDFGIGIPPDEYKNIFTRFHRARNVVNIDGTGLGLHIVEKNVHLLNGQISFTSELGCGSEFTVTFPYETLQWDETENKIIPPK